jgi:hypothetical protein
VSARPERRSIARRALTAFALAGAFPAAQAQTAPTYAVAFRQQALPPNQGASGAVGAGYDNFFGKGIVDALKAVTR